MPVPYAASRQDVKINLGYIASRSVSYLKRAMFHISPILLATYTQPEPTVFDAVMRTYLACWQGNFGLAARRPTAEIRAERAPRAVRTRPAVRLCHPDDESVVLVEERGVVGEVRHEQGPEGGVVGGG